MKIFSQTIFIDKKCKNIQKLAKIHKFSECLMSALNKYTPSTHKYHEPGEFNQKFGMNFSKCFYKLIKCKYFDKSGVFQLNKSDIFPFCKEKRK